MEPGFGQEYNRRVAGYVFFLGMGKASRSCAALAGRGRWNRFPDDTAPIHPARRSSSATKALEPSVGGVVEKPLLARSIPPSSVGIDHCRHSGFLRNDGEHSRAGATTLWRGGSRRRCRTHRQAARRAWRRFGRRNHAARLNPGDCFAYALADLTGEPLLFKGEDFARTDIEAA